MLTWLSMNWINIVLVAGLVLAVALIVAGRIRQKRAGKLPCGCDCGSCPTAPAASSARKKTERSDQFPTPLSGAGNL